MLSQGLVHTKRVILSLQNETDAAVEYVNRGNRPMNGDTVLAGDGRLQIVRSSVLKYLLSSGPWI